MIPLAWYYINRTRPGLHLRAVGEYPSAADALGINVFRMRYAYVFVGGMLITLAVGSFAFAVSAMSSSKGRTISITLGAIVAMYLADLLGNLSDKADWLMNLSLFHYWRPSEIIDDLHLSGDAWLVFGITAVLLFAVGMWAFGRRDVV